MQKQSFTLPDTQAYERQAAEQIPAEDRPCYHLTPRVGWMNDPNGFCFYQGAYHLFYQYYPYDTVWGPMHWGHAISRDLMHWDYLPAALAPDTAADAGGCFSGTALPLEDGRLMLMYTGVQQPDGQQAQCIAIGDGVSFVKQAGNPVITAAMLPQGYSAQDFRDPKVWRGRDGTFYCMAANRHAEHQGCVVMLESADGLNWQFVTELEASMGQLGRMWECPDFFQLDGQQVLMVSPQFMQASMDGKFRPGNNTMALLGDYDDRTHRFTRRAVQPLDMGLDFYAPQTTCAPDGRRILIGWLENWETLNSAPRKHKWYGRMSVPRELSIRQGRIYQQPVREIMSLWQERIQMQGIRLQGGMTLPGIHGRQLDMTIRLHTEGSARCFELRFAQDAQHFTAIRCLLAQGEVVFDRTFSGTERHIPHVCMARACVKDGVMTLRLLLDGESAELFVNDGEQVLSSLLETPLSAEGITFCADGDMTVDVDAAIIQRQA
ncbi:MAG: glycoside hydrolase family 32 protein [Aristaeellaceae bacterium]